MTIFVKYFLPDNMFDNMYMFEANKRNKCMQFTSF